MIKFNLTVIVILFACIHHEPHTHTYTESEKECAAPLISVLNNEQMSFEGNLIDTGTWKSVYFTTHTYTHFAQQQANLFGSISLSFSHSPNKISCMRSKQTTSWNTLNIPHVLCSMGRKVNNKSDPNIHSTLSPANAIGVYVLMTFLCVS